MLCRRVVLPILVDVTVGCRQRNEAELLKKAKKPSNKAKNNKEDKSNYKENREECNMDNPKSALWTPFWCLVNTF